MYPLRAPTAMPPIITPSITACGSCSKISRSLHVPGSLSSPLHSTYFGLADCFGTNDHFIPVENPPPRDPREPQIFPLINNGVRFHAERFLHGLVAAQFKITVNIHCTLPKAPGDDLYLLSAGAHN